MNDTYIMAQASQDSRNDTGAEEFLWIAQTPHQVSQGFGVVTCGLGATGEASIRTDAVPAPGIYRAGHTKVESCLIKKSDAHPYGLEWMITAVGLCSHCRQGIPSSA